MKVLIVSYWFPPTNTMGAVRVGKFAKFLHEAGHDVRVLAARTTDDQSLPLEIPADHVVWARSHEADRVFEPLIGAARKLWRLLGLGKKAPAGAGSGAPPSPSRARAADMLKLHYYATIHFPDNRIGWRSRAVTAGRRLLRRWQPDVIVASAPPFTTLLVARKLSREFRVPWVAELRDLWVENPYYAFPAWRRPLDRLLEHRTLENVKALVTVTPLWAKTLERHYKQPVLTILNGYAEEDLVPAPAPTPSEVVSILYTGNIYAGYRDPSPLFAAIALLNEKRNRVAVEFYGPSLDDIRHLAERHGVADRVFVRPRISYRESLARQAGADALLLLQWNHINDEGNIPAKLFEYLGARRPILFIGYEQGTVAQMIRERNAGFVSNAPEAIARQLERWIDARSAAGGIAALDASVRDGLSRNEQFRAFETFLDQRFSKRSCAT